MFFLLLCYVCASDSHWQSSIQRAGGFFSCAERWNASMIVHGGMRRRYGCGYCFYGFILRKNQPNYRSMILKDRLEYFSYVVLCLCYKLLLNTAATKEEMVALIREDRLECISYVELCLCYRLPLTELQTKSRLLLFLRSGMKRRYDRARRDET